MLMLATVGIWMVAKGADALPTEVEQVGSQIAAFAVAHDDFRLVNVNYKALPFAMTIPLGVARAQQMAVTSLKRHREIESISRHIPAMKGAGGIIAGLALMQAAGGPSGH